MKNQTKWLALVLGFVSLIAGSLGCATMAATSAVSRNDSDFYSKPALSDEIIAIGKPDEALAKKIGQEHVVAFLGIKNTYMLYKGGEELEQIAQLKLEGKRLDIDAARSHKLYLKDKQVWGELMLTYGGGNVVSAAEQAELEKAGFTPIKGAKNNLYQKKIDIEGVISQAIKLSEAQMAQLITRREFNLYNPRDVKPPLLPRIAHDIIAIPVVAVGVAVDIVLMPVYFGITAVVLVAAVVVH